MKKYLYFWIEKYRNLDDFDESKGYLFENFGVNLSSQYVFHHEWDSEKLKIIKELKTDIPEFFYSENIIDIKALVGNNGCGKTTLLTSLFQFVANGVGTPPSGMGNYALLFIENDTFYISTSLKDDEIDLPMEFTEERLSKSHVSDYAIYYSTAFDDQEYKIDNMAILGNLIGACDISTNALLNNDQETLKNYSTSVDDDYPEGMDALHCYYSMEQRRRIEFIHDFLDAKDFWKDFNLPRRIQMSIIEDDVNAAFFEIIQHQIKDYSIKDFLTINCLEETQWKKLNGYPKDRTFAFLKSETLDAYKNFYDKLILTNKFRLAAIMNAFRTYKDTELLDDSIFNLKALQEIFKDGREFNKSMLLSNPILLQIIESIESIIKIFDDCIEDGHNGFASYKNRYLNNSKVIFDLDLHRKYFIRTIDIYNGITKTSPFISFGYERPLSSGESSMLKLYCRLYDALKNQQDGERKDEIHFFLDEIDLYLHPEWQRQWLQRFINGLKYIGEALNRNLKFQIFLTTHSPFMLTDFLTDNVVLLKRESPSTKTAIEKYQGENIFGANIYSLIQSGFFLKNSVGCLFESKIRNLLSQEKKDSIKDLDKNLVYSQIGDPIIKGLVRDSISWSDANDSREN